MRRSKFDKIISSFGLFMAAILVLGGCILLYAHNFVHKQVHDQLLEQQITFPAAGSSSLTSLPKADATAMSKYAGQQMLTGDQAETYADHFIRVHLTEIAGGKTYSQISAESQADPTNAKLSGQANTLFKGETLRGLLLNAYAFDTMATVAKWGAVAAFVGAAVMVVLSYLGFHHAEKTSRKKR